MLDVTENGDVLLVEQIDRISRLNATDWESLKKIMNNKEIKIVSIDLPTSHQFIKQKDEFTQRMLLALNEMMLDVLAAIVGKDYEDRRRRQAQGAKKAKALGKYKGRPVDTTWHNKIVKLLKDGKSYSNIQNLIGCSRHTISKVKKQLNSKNNSV